MLRTSVPLIHPGYDLPYKVCDSFKLDYFGVFGANFNVKIIQNKN